MSNSCSSRSSQPIATTRARRGGFTLIELLVVIAIISILASMLFPAFSRAREQARKIVCISNLKQVGLGIMQYKQDYDEGFPTGYPFWVTGKPANQYLSGVVDPYIKDTRVWSCPSWNGAYPGSANFIGNFDFITGDTAPSQNNVIGAVGAASPYNLPAKDAALGRPSEYPLLFCGIPPQHISPPMLNIHAAVPDAAWGTAGSGLQGGSNILYADGHAKYNHFDMTQWNTLYNTPLGG